MSFNAAGGWGMAIKGIADTGKELTTTYLRGKQAQMNIISLESQMEMTQLAAKQNLGYINEELGQNLWNLYDYSKQMKAQQNAAMAASGFTDISTGDKRIFADTTRKTKEAAEGMNRSAFLKAFETQKAADLKTAALKGEIAQQKIVKKYNSGLRGAFYALNRSFLNFMSENSGDIADYMLSTKGSKGLNSSPVMEADYFEKAAKTLSSGAQSSTIPSWASFY